MIRLLGEVAALQGSLNEARAHLMNGLVDLVSGYSWVWTLLGELDPERPTHTVFLRGGFTEEEFAAYLKLQEHPALAWMTEKFLIALEGGENQVTRMNHQINDDDEVRKSSVIHLLREANTFPVILSGRPTSTGQISIALLFREFDGKPFTAREARIAHIMMSEVSWLHERSWPDHPRDKVSELSPRPRTVLILLLEGKSRKEIAGMIGISIETLHGYIKEIFKHFAVHSQTELMHRFYRGDGGDLP